MPSVEQRTSVVIVQHPRERRHPFGTVRLARLGLADVRVHVAWGDGQGRTRCPECADEDAAVLYPFPDAVDVRELATPPRTLVVVDGTWSTARKVIRDNAWLRARPRVKVTPPRAGRYRIRRAPDPSRQLSTIEALVFALQALEPDNRGLARLLDAFDAMIERQLAYRRPPRGPRSCGNGARAGTTTGS